jgi:hypothetical protein
MTEVRTNTSEITGAPICAGEASPLRVATGGNANWSSKVRCRRSPARANRRRDGRLWSPNEKTGALPLNQTEYVI